MTDTTKPDPKEVSASFNELLRNQRDLRRVRATPATSRDALRVAAGHEQHHSDEEPEPGTHPWRSLEGPE